MSASGESPHKLFRGILFSLAAGVSWAIMDASVKVLHQGFSFDIWELAFIRASVGLVGLVAVYWLLYRTVPKANNKKLLSIRGINGALVTICIFYAITYGSLGVTTVLVKSSTLWTALLAALVLGERLSAKLLGMILLGIIGVATLVGTEYHHGGSTFSYVMGLLAALLMAVTSVVIKKLHASENSSAIVAYFLGVSALISAPMALPLQLQLWGPALGWLALMVVCGTVGQLCFTKSFQYAPASVAFPFSLTEVLGASLFGVLLFDEAFTVSMVAGSLLIILSSLGIVWSQNRY